MPSHDPHPDSHPHHGVGHVVAPKILIATAVALLVLTVITVWSAKFDFGNLNIYIALAIATLKASLVVLFFMHLRWDRPFNSIVFVGSIALIALFIGGAMTDSTEYQGDLIRGDAPVVAQEIAELQAQITSSGTAAGTEGEHAGENADTAGGGH